MVTTYRSSKTHHVIDFIQININHFQVRSSRFVYRFANSGVDGDISTRVSKLHFMRIYILCSSQQVSLNACLMIDKMVLCHHMYGFEMDSLEDHCFVYFRIYIQNVKVIRYRVFSAVYDDCVRVMYVHICDFEYIEFFEYTLGTVGTFRDHSVACS